MRWLAAILLIYLVLRIPGIGIPLDRDEGAFGYMGQVIRADGLPYRDGLDHKPPVAFYINALALEFVPSTARGVHVFLAIYNALTLILLYFAARIYFASASAGLWTAFSFAVFSASPDIQGFTASTEMWALLPICASLLAAIVGVRKPAFLLLSGAAGAIACWTKQTMVTSVLFVAFYAILGASRVQLWRRAGTWLAGALGVSVFIALFFYFHNDLREMIYWVFRYGFSYASQASLADKVEDLGGELLDLVKSNFVILALGIGMAIWNFKRWGWFVLGFLLFSLIGTIPGFAYVHYLAQLAPAVALAAGQGMRVLTERMKGRVWVPAACAALMAANPLLADRDYFFERDPNAISANVFGENPFPESKPVADYLASRTTPDDFVWIAGSEPQILFYARRRSPSPFLMIYPLLTPHSRYIEFQHQMMAEVTARRPKYILSITGIPQTLVLDEDADAQILRFLDATLQNDYVLERSLTVEESGGRWIEPGGEKGLTTPYISIFRRRQ